MLCINLIDCEGDINEYDNRKYSNTFFLETIRGIKVNVYIHVYDISLYISCVLSLCLVRFCCSDNFLQWGK